MITPGTRCRKCRGWGHPAVLRCGCLDSTKVRVPGVRKPERRPRAGAGLGFGSQWNPEDLESLESRPRPLQPHSPHSPLLCTWKQKISVSGSLAERASLQVVATFWNRSSSTSPTHLLLGFPGPSSRLWSLAAEGTEAGKAKCALACHSCGWGSIHLWMRTWKNSVERPLTTGHHKGPWKVDGLV